MFNADFIDIEIGDIFGDLNYEYRFPELESQQSGARSFLSSVMISSA